MWLRRLEQHCHVGPGNEKRIGAGQCGAADELGPQQSGERTHRQAELRLIAFDDAGIFRTRFGQPQQGRVVLLRLVGDRHGGRETGEENRVLIAGKVLGQHVQLGMRVLDERLPVDFVDRDAGERVDLHRVLVGLGPGQGAIELQVFAHRPAAGEQIVGPRQLVGTSGLPAVHRGLGARGLLLQLGLDQADLVPEPGPARNVAVEQVFVVGDLGMTECPLGIGFRSAGGNCEPQRYHAGQIGICHDKPASDVFPLGSANQDSRRVEPRRAVRRTPQIVRISLYVRLTLTVDRRIRLHGPQKLPLPPVWPGRLGGQAPFGELQFANRHVVIRVLRHRRRCRPADGNHQAERPQARRHGHSSLFRLWWGDRRRIEGLGQVAPDPLLQGRNLGREYNAPAKSVNQAGGVDPAGITYLRSEI